MGSRCPSFAYSIASFIIRVPFFATLATTDPILCTSNDPAPRSCHLVPDHRGLLFPLIVIRSLHQRMDKLYDLQMGVDPGLFIDRVLRTPDVSTDGRRQYEWTE